jgi:osmotically-inducible protein OsmY
MAQQLVASPADFERDSDKRLFLGLRRRLWEYEPLRASRPQIDLDVRHGVVRVGGRVRTLAMKEIVGYLCQRTEGVAAVRNDLVSDTEVVRQVADAIATDPELGALCIKVDVRAGVATLAGELPEAALEARVLEAARTAPDVTDVVSELVVRRPERPPTAPPPRTAEAAAMAPEQAEPVAAGQSTTEG